MQKFSSLVNRPALKKRKAFCELTGNHGEKPDAFDNKPIFVGQTAKEPKNSDAFFKNAPVVPRKMNKTDLKGWTEFSKN